MAADEDEPGIALDELNGVPPMRRRRLWRWVAIGFAVVVLLAALAAWLSRDRIAENIISGQLDRLGLPATYQVESIGTGQQVLRNVVIGDPARPDMTIERVIVHLVPRFGTPAIGRIALQRPRLYGSLHQGKLSFGSLDKVLFTGGKAPFRLPDLDLAVADGRALLETDYGPVGIKLEGSGRLRGGFDGMLAAIAPQAAYGSCALKQASIYGRVTVSDEKPHFSGPWRLASLDCAASGLHLSQAAMQLDAVIDSHLDGLEARLDMVSGALGYGQERAGGTNAKAHVTWRAGMLTADYQLAASQVFTPQAALGAVAISGTARGQDGLGRLELVGEVKGTGLTPGIGFDRALASAGETAKGSFAAPLLAKLRAALQREGPGSRFTASFIHRQTGSVANLVVPQAVLTGGSGQTLLALSRFQYAGGGDTPLLSGNFSTGGRDLPQINGRMERGPGGTLGLRLTMADYAAGTSHLALPELVLAQAANGALGFAGNAQLSGPLPGGGADNLALPIEGNWARGRGLAVWHRCTEVRFDRLALANLTLRKRAITLCPQPGSAILVSDGRGTRLAAGTASLDLAGMLGATPIRVTGGAAGFAWPGSLAMKAVDVELGNPAAPSRFRIASLAARLGKDVAGRFAGADVKLAAVPLDVLGAQGAWRYAGGELALSDVAFRLADRRPDARFQPLVAQGASLLLANNRVTGEASLREPRSQREVVLAQVRHDLNSAAGHADLTVRDLVFDKQLQPDMLSRVLLGVVANVEGKLRGTGQIDWTAAGVRSTGRFSSDSLDFAAAFGPAKGVSGTVEFTDLLGLVTAPDQHVKIASINPGIEVTGGELHFELRPGNVAAILGARWPFLDGTLTLEPTQMTFGVAETRRYVLRIQGLDAAKFVERIGMANINATGTFDGAIPLVFDENGGRIAGGQLISRPPGGNVSYIGALTYKDLSAMANFAFDALKSLDYKRMQIDLEGPLQGEIITHVAIDGIAQGKGAKRNFITNRIARLPIKFNVNVRAPFFKLVGSLRSLYDPSALRDPRELGLVGPDGKPLQLTPAPPPSRPVPNIQPPASEKGL